MKKEVREEISKIKEMILNTKEDVVIVHLNVNYNIAYEITLRKKESYSIRLQKLEVPFNDDNIKEGLNLAIKIKDNNKYKVCFVNISDTFIKLCDEEYASDIIEDCEDEVGDTFENMFGKLETTLPVVKVNSDKCCSEFNVVFDLLCKSSEEIAIGVLHQNGFVMGKDWDEDVRESHLYYYFFTEDTLKKGVNFFVEIIKGGKKRVCVLYADREQVVIYGKPIAEKLLYKFKVPENVTIDTFENMFEKIQGDNIQRIDDISFPNIKKEVQNGIDAEKYETIQVIIEKLSESQKILDIDFFNKDRAYWMLDSNENKEESQKSLRKYFGFFTDEELTEGVYLTIRTYVDGKRKRCEIIIKPEQIALLDTRIVRKHIKAEYEDEFYCNLDETPEEEWDEDIKEALENNPEDFENLFGEFNDSEMLVRIEIGEDGKWMLT